jgi:uncharacterized caspase-like protein
VRTRLFAIACYALLWAPCVPAAVAQPSEPRIAFVAGNAGYERKPIGTALNDAALVAAALRSVGFEVVEGADLTQAEFLQNYRAFVDRVEAAGPAAIAFVYVSGYGLEFEGDDYILPVGARLEREADIPLQGLRLADLVRPLASAPMRAKVVAIDAARSLPFAPPGLRLAPGLAAFDPPAGMLLAISAAPGTVAPDVAGDYGAYATAIAEMIRTPGLDLDTAFVRVRMRTHQMTQGQQTPWQMSALNQPVALVPADPHEPTGRALRQDRPMRDLGVDEAYALAIERDTLPAYTAFVEAYPQSPYTPRVRTMIRARREALVWLRTRQLNTAPAYWTYLRRYPNGSYVVDAERRLQRLGMARIPPAGFVPIEFEGVPLPPANDLSESADNAREQRLQLPRMLMAPPPALFARLPAPVQMAPRALPLVVLPPSSPAPAEPAAAVAGPMPDHRAMSEPAAAPTPAEPAVERPPVAALPVEALVPLPPPRPVRRPPPLPKPAALLPSGPQAPAASRNGAPSPAAMQKPAVQPVARPSPRPVQKCEIINGQQICR